jgi:hypothetical protein
MNFELKHLLMVVGFLAIVYLINRYSSDSQESFATTGKATSETTFDIGSIPEDTSNDYYSSESSLPSVSVSDKEMVLTESKFDSKNKSKDGAYKRANYAEGSRGQDSEDVTKYFDDYNSLVKEGHLANDEYVGNDETGNALAPYRAGPKKPITDDEIFKSENYLPKETNKDWFEVMPEPISVKNRHLINVSRPVGVNTIGNSLRNPSYDLRGSPPCPKFVVSPWAQSTIEPDYNIKGLC